MSLVLVVSRGILAMMSPAGTFCPSSTRMLRPDREKVAGLARGCRAACRSSPSASLMEMRGRTSAILRLDDDARGEPGQLVDLLPHRHAFDDVAELDLPVTSVRIGMVYGSHSASRVAVLDLLAVLRP